VILFLRVRVVGRHHAPWPQTRHGDEQFSYSQLPARPGPLGQPLDAADDDVGAEPPRVDADRGDGAVGRDREGQDVEAVEPVVGDEVGVFARGGDSIDPSLVAKGISEALLITFEGVFLSVPAIYFYALFRNRVSMISVTTMVRADQFLRHFAHAARGKGAGPGPAAQAAAAAKVARP